jgi:hypothetical protein
MKNLLTLIFLSFIVFNVQSVPIRCLSSVQAVTLEDEEILDLELLETDPCEDHNVCELNCRSYFPGCSSTIYFNLDPLIPQNVPKKNKPGFGELSVYHAVCTRKMFAVPSESSKNIYKIINKYLVKFYQTIPKLNKVKLEQDLNKILIKFPTEFDWDGNYEVLIGFYHRSYKLKPVEVWIAQGLQKMTSSFRNFKKICPKDANLKTITEKFKIFEEEHLKEVSGASRDFLNINTSFGSYKIISDWEKIIKNLKERQTKLQKIIFHYKDLKKTREKQIYSNAVEKLKVVEKDLNDYLHYLDILNEYKSMIIKEVLPMYLDPKFIEEGGNMCQCFDFVKFLKMFNSQPGYRMRNTFGIDHKGMEKMNEKYFSQMKTQCKLRCN